MASLIKVESRSVGKTARAIAAAPADAIFIKPVGNGKSIAEEIRENLDMDEFRRQYLASDWNLFENKIEERSVEIPKHSVLDDKFLEFYPA